MQLEDSLEIECDDHAIAEDSTVMAALHPRKIFSIALPLASSSTSLSR